MGVYSGNGSVSDDRRKGTGFIFHHKIKWRLTSNRVRAVVVHEFGMGNRLKQRCGIIATEDAKIGFYFLVYSFSFTIGLWVISGGKGKVIM